MKSTELVKKIGGPMVQADQRGFVVPAVLLALTVLSVLAVAALTIGSDERLSARAMRDASIAFYAAEAGRNEVPSIVSDSMLANLAPGDSLDLGWRDLDYGSSYRALIRRLDEGGDVQTLYMLRVEGRGRGAASGQRVVTEMFSFSPFPELNAAIKARGRVKLEDTTQVSGVDQAPPEWIAAGVCDPDSTQDVAGIRMEDLNDLQILDPEVEVLGSPATEEDTTINNSTFNEFGGPTWDDLINLADHVIGLPDEKLNPEIRPSYNMDGSCNTDDPFNWGSNDPSDPCFDYFPVIYVQKKGLRISLGNGYAQAFVITDAEFDIQSTDEPGNYTGPGEFAGVVLSRGCLEVNLEQAVYGGIIHDRVDAIGCLDNEKGLWFSGNPSDPSMPSPDMHYSSCVVERTIEMSRVGSLFGWHRIKDRPFGELNR